MVTIYHTYNKFFRYIYLNEIKKYLDIVNIFLGVTGSLILNVCAKFGFFYFSALFNLFETKTDTGKKHHRGFVPHK